MRGNISFAIPTCFCNCSANPYYKVKLCFESLGKNPLTSKLLNKNLLISCQIQQKDDFYETLAIF